MFTDYQGRKREPLGGKEVPGFGPWLHSAHKEVTESLEVLRRTVPVENPVRYIANSAHRDFAALLHRWRLMEMGKSPNVSDEHARDDFEVSLIADVMSAHGAREYAVSIGWGERPEPTGRPMVDVDAAYERACTFLARYMGIDPKRVKECGGDQDKLMGLGDGR